jgi:uncharacterized Zn finger protein (UPF0148 family)
MTTATCTECGNPRVHMTWNGEVWTGRCSSCDSILFATKDYVTFGAPTGEKT